MLYCMHKYNYSKMRPTKEQLNRKARIYGFLGLAFIIAVCIIGSAISSSMSDDTENSELMKPIPNIDVSSIPDDGEAHTLYTDKFGFKIRGKVIHIGHSYNSYMSHIIWTEHNGSIYAESISTH
jgi:hypothetical protein